MKPSTSNPVTQTHPRRDENAPKGFALVATLSLLPLLLVLAVGMLSLSSVSIRNASADSATVQARANARMALMLAIGELQVEMGPDMRISAEAAVHDTNPATEEIDGVAQPHWTAVYDSWGGFLNGQYTPEGKSSADVQNIGDTYDAKRSTMFRRWLVSLPEGLQADVNAATLPLTDEESVIMVGEGTLGRTHTDARPEEITRAYKIQVGERGAYAWWVSPENHKAKINLAAQKRDLSADQWATAQGVTSEVAIGGIEGLESLDDSNADAAALASRIVSLKTLDLPAVVADQETTKAMFFDLTDMSSGILANTRSGGMKKDLSLLFENSDTTIAPEYTQANYLAPEPSIRPHSTDVLAENAALPRRPFAGWPNMRHYYRMYREDTDSELPVYGHLAQRYGQDQPETRTRDLSYSGSRVSTGVHVPYDIHEDSTDGDDPDRWFGQNSYQRFPILIRFLLIHAYETIRFEGTGGAATPLADPADPDYDGIALVVHNIPVFTYWNPYSVPLVIEHDRLAAMTDSNVVWPHFLAYYNKDGTPQTRGGNPMGATSSNRDRAVPVWGEAGAAIVLEPGELKVFSYPPGARLYTRGGGSTDPLVLIEGFDPTDPGGLADRAGLWWQRIPGAEGGVLTPFDLAMEFGPPRENNAINGNTPGSLTLKMVAAGNAPGVKWGVGGIPPHYQIDWFQASQQRQPITNKFPMIETSEVLPVAYSLFTLKGTSQISSDAPSWEWREDWRSRNWLHAPPYYFGSGLYMTEDSVARAHTQRLDSPYEVSFGPTSDSELIKLTGSTLSGKPFLGFGSTPREKVTAVPAIELPTAPLSSLASFSGMRMSPGWIWSKDLNPDWEVGSWKEPSDRGYVPAIHDNSAFPRSLISGGAKAYQYQSGITGGGIGNSFIHPMIPREEVYFFHDNSFSHDYNFDNNGNPTTITTVNTKAFSDYWDHVLMLNDALWDEYFISSLADQTRPWASESDNLQANIEALTNGEGLPISRYQYHDAGMDAAAVEAKLTDDDAYLRAAEHLTVDGAFNVNSTSVKAWYALFKGIRERKLFYRDSSGQLLEVAVPAGHIALSRFDTPTTDRETTDLSAGVAREDGNMAWSGVRFLDDLQIRLLAGKCVEQVKRRGPFLNFSEFINRRLENSELGLMGALQAAIDYDDASPDSGSINYRYKSTGNLRISPSDLGSNEYPTPEAVEGSRLAGIPGYVIQSDLLKPIANTLQVRDDTFRIRAYGEALDSEGKVIARAWCEAIVQRNPRYVDPANEAHEPAYLYEGNPLDGSYDPRWNGEFIANGKLTETNRRFGRKFEIISLRWLNSDEV